MSSQLTPDQRIALLEELEKQETVRRGRAARVAWGSVAAAAFVLVLLVFGAQQQLVRTERQLEEVERARDAVAADIERLNVSKAEVDRQLKESQAALTASLGALGRVSETQRQAAVEEQLTADPSAALILPRVYLHIVDSADRAWATDIGRTLESAGIITLGVEFVPRAAGLKSTDVRYYRASEEGGAVRIVKLLESVGVGARLTFLNLEDSTKVRPNHFEVWFAAGARNSSLHQAPAPASSVRMRHE